LLLLLGTKSYKRFLGAEPLDEGLFPWTPLGAPPPDPIIGSRSTHSPCVSSVHPTFFDLATPLSKRRPIVTIIERLKTVFIVLMLNIVQRATFLG